ncbi:pyridoxamine 5-phosphate oxidase [Vibrio sp. qd031]|jgi:hypothetical protein|uniref:DUF3283 family protein n=1 Tax=Vibrio ulleungensis TaxID=2807619 RepID=A0ABS2HCY7_9VIBR|nr:MULTISPECIES: DUF3283 family protein [Vibrio]MBM7034931.1 DUF3283 family protein [Vibrio ulleungensis]ORT48575.1 pyridoxamine 5-phosphate oxidase [Vibrio sp. qd031]
MAFNLSLLPADEKNAIELDKQASYIVWQIKNGKVGNEALRDAQQKLSPQQSAIFDSSVSKYKSMLGVQ